MRDPQAFLTGLQHIVNEVGVDVLLPISEATLLVVLPARSRFACAIPFVDAKTFERICDKREVLEQAKKQGIPVPGQVELYTAGETTSVKNHPPFPVALKPSRSVAGESGKRVRVGVSYADDEQELNERLGSIFPHAYPVLVQQRIRGTGFGISVLVWEGKLIASFAHRRIREKPPSGGVSVISESIAMDPALLAQSLGLLKSFAWNGVAMVEYKKSEGGVPYLMEINGRLWGSLQLAIDAGVDFPRLLVEAALGMNPAPVTSYAHGVRLRWEWGAVDHLFAMLRDRSMNSLPGRVPGGRTLRAVSEFFQGFDRVNRPEIFRADDPRPFARETIDWLLRR
jgi:predicted ATP-grasp superfamily ATP-dependent carboligase